MFGNFSKRFFGFHKFRTTNIPKTVSAALILCGTYKLSSSPNFSIHQNSKNINFESNDNNEQSNDNPETENIEFIKILVGNQEGRIILQDIKLYEQDKSAGKNVLILVKPMVYNHMFLGEIRNLIFQQKSAVPDQEIFYTTQTSNLSKLDSGDNPLAPLADQDQFLIKNSDQKVFETISFDKYFGSPNYIHSHYQMMKVVPQAQREMMESYLERALNSEQMLVLGFLDKQNLKIKNQLHTLQSSENLMHSKEIKILAMEPGSSTLGDYQEGDQVFLQKLTKSSIVNKDTDEIINIGNQKIHTRINRKKLLDNSGQVEQGHLASVIYDMNIFMPQSILDHNKVQWQVKIKIDDNRIDGKKRKEMKTLIQQFRKALDEDEVLRKKVAIVKDKGVIDNDVLEQQGTEKAYWDLFLQNIARQDLQTMYFF